MSDEPKKRRRGWIGWALVALLVLYPISVFPVALVGAWLKHWGLLSHPAFDATTQKVYAPVTWAMERVPLLDRAMTMAGDSLEPLAPDP
jgi:hypothetical protein